MIGEVVAVLGLRDLRGDVSVGVLGLGDLRGDAGLGVSGRVGLRKRRIGEGVGLGFKVRLWHVNNDCAPSTFVVSSADRS